MAELLDKQKKKKKVKRSITPEEQIKEWLGPVDNLHHISYINVWDNKWRTNVYTRHEIEGQFCDSFKISQSYFLQTTPDGIVNLTK